MVLLPKEGHRKICLRYLLAITVEFFRSPILFPRLRAFLDRVPILPHVEEPAVRINAGLIAKVASHSTTTPFRVACPWLLGA